MGSKFGKKWMMALCGVGLLFAVAGCASKEDRALYERIHQRTPELKTLQQSEKVLFTDGDANGTIVLATYLPKADAREETFVIAVYPDESVPVEHFTLQGKSPSDLRKVRRKDLPRRLTETIPPWFAVYRLRFPQLHGKRFVLHVEGPGGASRDIPFYKGPKYLVTKPKF